MNERIDELAQQAGVNLSSFQFSGTPIKYEVSESDLEKFAELIVKKCIQIVENEASTYAEPVWAFELVNDIQEQFGIEP